MGKTKVLLKTDYLTGKILSLEDYSGDGEGDAVWVSDRRILQSANARGRDLYFTDGKIAEREKSENDFYERMRQWKENLETCKTEIRRTFSAYAMGKNVSEAGDTLFRLNGRMRLIKRRICHLQRSRRKRIREKVYGQLRENAIRYYCSICMIVKDDNEYLEEWFRWHIGQGVEHFYLYDHGSRESVAAFATTLPQEIREKLTVIDFGGEHEFAQHEAYNDCLRRFGGESRWIGFIDSDEMVRVKETKTLPEFLKEFESYAGLFVGWIMYGANGRVKKSNEPVRQRFTKTTDYDGQDGVGKVFVQPVMMRQMLTHSGYPVEGFSIVDENHNAVERGQAWKPDLPHERICIDHYYTKSYEEWTEKMRRGSCDPYFCRKYGEFFLYNPDMEFCREKTFPTQKYEGKKEIKIKGEIS